VDTCKERSQISICVVNSYNPLPCVETEIW